MSLLIKKYNKSFQLTFFCCAPKSVSTALVIPIEKIVQMIDKLEGLKTFLFRSDGKTVDWAYPLSLQNTGHELISLKGERLFAA